MPRGDWSLEVCDRHLETGKVKTGWPWLTIVVFLSLPFEVMKGKRTILPPLSKCESKKKKWKIKICCDEGELFIITEHT